VTGAYHEAWKLHAIYSTTASIFSCRRQFLRLITNQYDVVALELAFGILDCNAVVVKQSIIIPSVKFWVGLPS